MLTILLVKNSFGKPDDFPKLIMFFLQYFMTRVIKSDITYAHLCAKLKSY